MFTVPPMYRRTRAMGQMGPEEQPRHDGEGVPSGPGEDLHVEVAVNQCRTRSNVQAATEELSIGCHDIDRITLKAVSVDVHNHPSLPEPGKRGPERCGVAHRSHGSGQPLCGSNARSGDTGVCGIEEVSGTESAFDPPDVDPVPVHVDQPGDSGIEVGCVTERANEIAPATRRNEGHRLPILGCRGHDRIQHMVSGAVSSNGSEVAQPALLRLGSTTSAVSAIPCDV